MIVNMMVVFGLNSYTNSVENIAYFKYAQLKNKIFSLFEKKTPLNLDLINSISKTNITLNVIIAPNKSLYLWNGAFLK